MFVSAISDQNVQLPSEDLVLSCLWPDLPLKTPLGGSVEVSTLILGNVKALGLHFPKLLFAPMEHSFAKVFRFLLRVGLENIFIA